MANPCGTHPDGHIYKLVQLLRLNGVGITRAATGVYNLRMKRGVRARQVTAKELRERFGSDTIAYKILMQHPKAHTIT